MFLSSQMIVKKLQKQRRNRLVFAQLKTSDSSWNKTGVYK